MHCNLLGFIIKDSFYTISKYIYWGFSLEINQFYRDKILQFELVQFGRHYFCEIRAVSINLAIVR